ncbi:MAG: hypothetical protein MI802_22480 [Desulfobacterales bacterium]|nr:hypothetical protein [Desulfobacterales bacterium]
MNLVDFVGAGLSFFIVIFLGLFESTHKLLKNDLNAIVMLIALSIAFGCIFAGFCIADKDENANDFLLDIGYKILAFSLGIRIGTHIPSKPK